MVNPGGTGNPALVISASPAPLPPRSSFILPLPSALPPPKEKTYLVALFLLGLPLLPEDWISVSGSVEVAIMSPLGQYLNFGCSSARIYLRDGVLTESRVDPPRRGIATLARHFSAGWLGRQKSRLSLR